jgi:hypothetical protein
MGDAYTPGLTVTDSAVVRKSRRLPLPGQVLVGIGDRVGAEDVVARTELPGKVHLINFSNVLGVLPDEIAGTLRVEIGGAIEEGQLLAEHRSFFGLFRSRVLAPIRGRLESVSEVTGQTVLREPPQPVEVRAYIDGEVVEIIEGEGVVVETRAALVQGIFGLAGEVHAPLVMACKAPGESLEVDRIREEHRGKIIVGGAQATLGALRRAIEIGVAGVVVGGFAYHDIRELLGYDVGVAVTGTEELGTTLVVTEGFGRIAMARATFELLAGHDGAQASISGATQIRAGVIRPEVVIPRQEADDAALPAALGLDIGAPVRCIRAPYFGQIGVVTQLPVELARMPSETMVRVLEVELEGGEKAMIPRANVEVIEG